MKISEFRAGQHDLQTALRIWGVVRQAGEFEVLVAALQEFDDLTVAEFIKQLKKINATPAVPKAGKAPKQLNESAIELHLAKLEEVAHSSEVFDRALSRSLPTRSRPTWQS